MMTTERKKKVTPAVEYVPVLGTDILTGVKLGTAERKIRIAFDALEADSRLEGLEQHLGRAGVPMRPEHGFQRVDELNGIRMRFSLDTFVKTAPATWVAEVRKYFAKAPILNRFFAKNCIAIVESVEPVERAGNA